MPHQDEVNLRGLSAAAAEAAVWAMIGEAQGRILLDYELSMVGRGISTDVRLSKLALERARLAIVRDKLMDRLRAFVDAQVLAR